MLKRRFVVGDIHGGCKSLENLLNQVNFDFDNDELISLGDVCDGWSEVVESIELLMKIKNLVYVRGNHDQWVIDFITNPPYKFSDPKHDEYRSWLKHGGMATKQSYEKNPNLLDKHLDFLNKSKLFHIDSDNNLFVHAGYQKGLYKNGTLIEGNFYGDMIYLWDRDFWNNAYNGHDVGSEFKNVFIGHTPTLNYPNEENSHLLPIVKGNVYNVDTGSAFTGKLSMIEITNNMKVYQSDKRTMEYYPNEFGRNKNTFKNYLEY